MILASGSRSGFSKINALYEAVSMKNPVGVMQGRLLPKYKGRYQAHPVGYWEEEFVVASQLGLDCIEFILDYNDVEKNPLLSEEGINRIKSSINKTNVDVKSICADYFMHAPLHSANSRVVQESVSILGELLNGASELGVTDIVIPCVDESSLSNAKDISQFAEVIRTLVPCAQAKGINFSLETDLPPDQFISLLELVDASNVTVNYDIGNSAALGFDPIEEITIYGQYITDIHIKDRVLNGGPVVLGNGCANFSTIFTRLKEIEYTGTFIMQAYRDEEGLAVFKSQLDWITPYLNIMYD